MRHHIEGEGRLQAMEQTAAPHASASAPHPNPLPMQAQRMGRGDSKSGYI